MQAARKVLKESAELKALRAEKEEVERQKRERAAAEDVKGKRLAETEAALRKASSQLDGVLASLPQIDGQYAEVMAELQAERLRALEVEGKGAEGAKREAKLQKKLAAAEKQRQRVQVRQMGWGMGDGRCAAGDWGLGGLL